MLFRNFFRKKKETEIINYQELIDNSWSVLRNGLLSPEASLRLIVEETIFALDSPEGKRFFAAGIQEPDLRNQIFVLKKLYERGGWRLAENFLSKAFDSQNDLAIDERQEIITFLAGFSDPDLLDFLLPGLENQNKKIRYATIKAIIGINNPDALASIKKHFSQIDDSFELFLCQLALLQFGDPEGKKELEKHFSEKDLAVFQISCLQYLDFNKIKPYLKKILERGTLEIKKELVLLVKDNRGSELLEELLKEQDDEVFLLTLKQIAEVGISSMREVLKNLEKETKHKKEIRKTLAILGEKDERELLEKELALTDINQYDLEQLNLLAQLNQEKLAELLTKIILPIENIFLLKTEEVKKIQEITKLMIKYGKLDSLVLLNRYCTSEALEKNDQERWLISCQAATAILCLIERNKTYLRGKILDN